MPQLADGSLRFLPSVILQIIGWDPDDKEHKNGLEYTEIEVVNKDKCQSLYPNVAILETMLCVGGLHFDTCVGEKSVFWPCSGSMSEYLSSIQKPGFTAAVLHSGSFTESAPNPHAIGKARQ